MFIQAHRLFKNSLTAALKASKVQPASSTKLLKGTLGFPPGNTYFPSVSSQCETLKTEKDKIT